MKTTPTQENPSSAAALPKKADKYAPERRATFGNTKFFINPLITGERNAEKAIFEEARKHAS